MQRTTYRTLTNKELVQLASDHLYEQGTLDAAFSTELLRRLNWYTDGRGEENATIKDARQLELPL